MRLRIFVLAGIILASPAAFSAVHNKPESSSAERDIHSLPLKPAELYRLKAKVRKALRNSLGIEAPVFITALHDLDGVTWVEIPVSEGSVRLRLDPNADADLMDAVFIVQPSIVATEQAEYFQEVLAKLHAPGKILALGQVKSQGDSVRRMQLWVQQGADESARTMLQLERRGRAWSLVPYRYNEAAFRELAGQVATQAALDLTTSFEQPWNRLGALEVTLKSNQLQPKTFDFVSYDDSPIGFDIQNEKQLSLPPLVSDNVPYVTINPTTGAIRAELFN
ncbi:MAG TPA: hypothetical protein VE954_15205 [Oligoflexus sp.]|uniref:hypothetical protein n=1 Tax=Oligoflexus sp. TaxID=1971216 RepID=UPI002D6282DD|nr:hypothetical protein [Oligoflexus sp.]HYX34451.1 hypothetical protein [Oligoflexus sp.]